ncbi:butyrate kinase [Desulfovibrio subterraneus]|uniref:Probable butyrate kinase n=1 Tax=Desulfovibrio subterraneus TaxID=2718620 RepID=A0A7J0BEG7_9BACT|nr:butyrate kinase [Desulfovibrio subterraneus]WBF68875.1 butyrate kinase [Desulfovibrio subterraneus]GFM32077.1 putative butyrate kinase [Desulfovibrio subterraneus]
MTHILAINPGSTSTKVALFDGEKELFSHIVEHDKTELLKYERAMEQMALRRDAILHALAAHGYADVKLAAVVGRGGLLAPMQGGAWRVNKAMLDDLASAKHGEHPCNLGAPLALEFATQHGVQAVIVDPVVTDEMDSVARISGLPELPRRSVFHALSQRAAARHAARELGIAYENGKFLVCHMGGGISVAAHRHGRICDVVNALDGDGPFTPERTGRLPALSVLRLVHEGKYSYDTLRTIILKEGGLWAHLGTNDLREVERRMREGDEHAESIFEALAYNIAKELVSLAPSLLDGVEDPRGKDGISAIVVTGGMARSARLMERLRNRMGFLAPFIALPDVEEMQALAAGCLRVLQGLEVPRDYTGTGQDIL